MMIVWELGGGEQRSWGQTAGGEDGISSSLIVYQISSLDTGPALDTYPGHCNALVRYFYPIPRRMFAKLPRPNTIPRSQHRPQPRQGEAGQGIASK